MPSTDPPVRLLVLSAHLRDMRSQWGVSPALAAALAHVSPRDLAAWESGQVLPPAEGLQRLLQLYRQPPQVHEVLTQWATAPEDSGTRHHLVDSAPGWQNRLPAIQRSATGVRAFSSYTVPTPVRSSAYADHLQHRRSPRPVELTRSHRLRPPTVTSRQCWEQVDILLGSSILRSFDLVHSDQHPLAHQLAFLCAAIEERLAQIRILHTDTSSPAETGDEDEGTDLLGLTLPAGTQDSTVWVQAEQSRVTYINGPEGLQRQHVFDELSLCAASVPASAEQLQEAAAACPLVNGQRLARPAAPSQARVPVAGLPGGGGRGGWGP